MLTNPVHLHLDPVWPHAVEESAVHDSVSDAVEDGIFCVARYGDFVCLGANVNRAAVWRPNTHGRAEGIVCLRVDTALAPDQWAGARFEGLA